MDLDISLTQEIDEVQKKLRECNSACIRLKDLIASSLPSLLNMQAVANQELQSKSAENAELKHRLALLQFRFDREEVSETVAPQPVPESVENLTVELSEPPMSEQAAPLPVTELTIVQPTPEITNREPAFQPRTQTQTTQATQAPRPQGAPKSRQGLEEFIGGNILNKVGIGILIIGIGIFVKYAIDQDWIGAVGRVMIGLLSGGILMGVAHWLRKSYKAFSSVLLGGGIAVLYFSMAIAFHQYGLISQTAAFVTMCGITGIAVFFSIAYNRQEIAVLALLGAFATPFMVATGDGNWEALFTYLAIVNVGMLVLAWFRDWQLVRILGYAITLLLFGGWMGMTYMNDRVLPLGAFGFGTLFFLIFFLTNLAYRLRKKEVADSFTMLSLISNSAFYFGGAMLVLNTSGQSAYLGLFTAVIAAFHLGFIFALKRFLQFNDKLQLLLIGLALTFATLAIPIQLEGNYVTLFWAAESVLLLFLAQRAQIRLLFIGSAVVSALAVIFLAYQWALAYQNGFVGDHVFLLNGTYLTSLFTTAALVGLIILHRRSEGEFAPFSEALLGLYQYVATTIGYLGMVLELAQWLDQPRYASIIGVASFTGLYVSGLILWGSYRRDYGFATVATALAGVALVFWNVVQLGYMVPLRTDYMNGGAATESFPAHFLAFASMLVAFAVSVRFLAGRTNLQKENGSILIWGASILGLVLLSIELDNVLVMTGVPVTLSHRVGYPILWGLTGFGLIAWGLRGRLVAPRLGGLALFALILLKLFLFDIREVSAGGKIAAFISLGVLLLVISFMYQRIRKLLTDQEDQPADQVQ